MPDDLPLPEGYEAADVTDADLAPEDYSDVAGMEGYSCDGER